MTPETPRQELTWNRGCLRLDGPPLVMGILNLTPDSFYPEGRSESPEQAIQQGLAMIEQGADLLDLGAESTRPGAAEVSVDEELRRLMPVLQTLAEQGTVPISVDTRKAKVAKAVLEAGAGLINDVSGLEADQEMADVIAAAGCPVVLMHMRGNPADMQHRARYQALVPEVRQELELRLEKALRAGIRRDRIILDPGLGFAKTPEQCFELLQGLPQLQKLGAPLLVGPSRKSFIYRSLGITPAEALPGTLSVLAYCTLQGVEILRVHDVLEGRQAIQVAHRLRSAA